MPYLVGFMFVLSLVALPLRVSAQEGEETAQEGEPSPQEPARGVQRWHPDAFVDPADKTRSDFEIEYTSRSAYSEMERRVDRARTGVGISVIPLVLGAVIATAGAMSSLNSGSQADHSNQDAALYLGSALVGIGGVSMIATGTLLGVRKRKLRRLQEDTHLKFTIETGRPNEEPPEPSLEGSQYRPH